MYQDVKFIKGVLYYEELDGKWYPIRLPIGAGGGRGRQGIPGPPGPAGPGSEGSFYPACPTFGAREQGNAGNFNGTVVVDRSGYNGIIRIETVGLPPGLTTVSPIFMPATANSMPYVVVYDGTTPVGTYPFTLNFYKDASLIIETTCNSVINIIPPEIG